MDTLVALKGYTIRIAGAPSRGSAKRTAIMKLTLLARLIGLALTLALAAALSGCLSKPRQSLDSDADRLTVGTVQREIVLGMDAASVIEALGSPNIVTTDDKRREVWVYDKVSTERVDSVRSDHATLILIGTRTSASSSSTQQRTLTIIIKFDEQKQVRDFAYNSTRF